MTRDSVCRHLVHCAGHDLGSHSGCINPSNGNSAMAREKAVSTDVCGTEARSRLGYRLAVHRQRQRGRVGGVGKGASGSHSPHKSAESSQCNAEISPRRDFFSQFGVRAGGDTHWARPWHLGHVPRAQEGPLQFTFPHFWLSSTNVCTKRQKSSNPPYYLSTKTNSRVTQIGIKVSGTL